MVYIGRVLLAVVLLVYLCSNMEISSAGEILLEIIKGVLSLFNICGLIILGRL